MQSRTILTKFSRRHSPNWAPTIGDPTRLVVPGEKWKLPSPLHRGRASAWPDAPPVRGQTLMHKDKQFITIRRHVVRLTARVARGKVIAMMLMECEMATRSARYLRFFDYQTKNEVPPDSDAMPPLPDVIDDDSEASWALWREAANAPS